MKTVRTAGELRATVQSWRAAGETVAFVPTMGNLHAGHLALVARARAVAPRVVVSIFVNPMQFGPDEDLDRYPVTPEEDTVALRDAGADLLFMPAAETLYPQGMDASCVVEVPGLNAVLEGEHRPTHFNGVSTVVAKLFNLVQPDIAVFGEKDYQQLLLIRRMVADLCMPVTIESVATVRERDGLAMSSRNQYLRGADRSIAARLHQTLLDIATVLKGGERDYAGLEQAGARQLEEAGFAPDYVSIRRSEDLMLPAPGETALVVLAAARIGETRLIDNIRISVA